MKNQNIPLLTIVAALSLGLGFFAGTKYQTTQKAAFVNQFNQRGSRDQQLGSTTRTQGGQMMGSQNRAMGTRPVSGEITNSDSKSITVKMPDGSSKIVMLSSSTQINKAESAVVADLKVGEKVSVFGTSNTDGSVTAQNIQLNPLMLNTATISATPAKK
jgi:uncharacterized protein (DUF3084 family)